MKSILHRFIPLFLVLVGIVCSFPAQAAFAVYEFKTVDYPHAVSTSLWGINNAGQIIGQAQFMGNPTALSFLYNPQNGVFTSLPPVPGQVDSDTERLADDLLPGGDDSVEAAHQGLHSTTGDDRGVHVAGARLGRASAGT